MSDFNPYHKWLGIPLEEQPPTYYRLLGIKAFESDPDVIQHAVDQRMTHLRSLQTGKHAELSQRLLNEVAAVGACLLNEQRRLAYDAKLRGRQKVTESTVARPAPLPPSQPRPVPRDSTQIAAPPVVRPQCLHCNSTIDYSDPDTFEQLRCRNCGEQVPPPPPGLALPEFHKQQSSADNEILELLGVANTSVAAITENEVVSDTILCRFCREPIKRDAIKCKHCGEFFKLSPVAESRIPEHLAKPAGRSFATAANRALAFSLFGLILCAPLGLFGAIVGAVTLSDMNRSGNFEGADQAKAAIGIGVFDCILWFALFLIFSNA